jgi:hypothetical protein
LEQRLTTFGGFSLRTGVTGVWVSGGHTYRDRSLEYTVSLESWLQLAAWLETVQWAGEHTHQAAVYIEVAGIPEILPGAGE